MYKISIIFSMVFIFNLAFAEDLSFETTAEGITKALTCPKNSQRIKTRSIMGLDGTKTRSIKIIAQEQGKIFEKAILVSQDSTNQGVNLKIEFDINSYSIRPNPLY